jgi:hypothetical protein
MSRNRLWAAVAAAGLACLAAGLPARAAVQYKLAYWFEVGGNQNANGCVGCSCTGTGNHSLYVHVVDADGTKLGGIRVEDADYPDFNGTTSSDPNDKPGFVEIPIPLNNSPRAKVNNAGLASDVTAEMIEARGPTGGHYSWECAFMRVPDGVSVTFDSSLLGTPNISSYDGNAGCILNAPFTRSCAYYDVNPLSWASDAFDLPTEGASSFGQTFVANGNRVVMAKFQTTIGYGQTYRYGVRIRENGPGGAVLGSTAVSRVVYSDEYFPQIVTWAVSGPGAVEVVFGQTYYAEVYRADTSGSISCWYRRNNVYPDGQMYRAGVPVSGSDLVGRVICATVSAPEIQLNTSVLTPPPVQCSAPPEQTFTITNSGQGTLSYTVTANQPWLRVLPDHGDVPSGQIQAILVRYRVQGLAAGPHQARITVSDPKAPNSPQEITVGLNVVSPLAPGDFDGDCDVDQADFGRFQACYTGAGIDVTETSCLGAQLDADADVDVVDFGIFAACMSGPSIQASPSCGP